MCTSKWKVISPVVFEKNLDVALLYIQKWQYGLWKLY